MKQVLSVFFLRGWETSTHPGCTPNLTTTDTFSPQRLAWYHGWREAIYQLCQLLPVPDRNRQSCTHKKTTGKKNPKNSCNALQKSRTTYPCGSSSRRSSSTLCASPSTLTLLAHTSAHKPRPVWGHFTLHSPTSIFHLHNREGAAREEESPP